RARAPSCGTRTGSKQPPRGGRPRTRAGLPLPASLRVIVAPRHSRSPAGDRPATPLRQRVGLPAMPETGTAAVPPEIFKAYDVRGLYGDQIDGDVAELVGRAFVRVLGGLAGKPIAQLRVGLGRDMRLTAPELAGRYREG